MIISVMGMDGSGKTTITKKLKEKLDGVGFSTEILYPYRYFILGFLLKSFKLKERKGSVSEKTKKDGASFQSKLWSILVWFDLIPGKWLSLILLKLGFFLKKYSVRTSLPWISLYVSFLTFS